MVTSDLRARILDAVDVPTLPSTLAQIREVMSRSDAGVADVAEIVAQDPPVAAKVLRLANTAYYAPRERIATIGHAAAVLGMSVLENLVLQVTLVEAFASLDGKTVEDLWVHSVLVARTTQEIVKRSRMPDALPLVPEELYTCGLLHDIGKFVMLGSLGHDYLTVLQRARDSLRESYLQERVDLGYNHTEVGAVMAHLWRFPPGIVEAIELHHSPRILLRARPHVAVVVLADQIADLVHQRALRRTVTPDIALLKELQVPLKETEPILRFAELCLQDIEL